MKDPCKYCTIRHEYEIINEDNKIQIANKWFKEEDIDGRPRNEKDDYKEDTNYVGGHYILESRSSPALTVISCPQNILEIGGAG